MKFADLDTANCILNLTHLVIIHHLLQVGEEGEEEFNERLLGHDVQHVAVAVVNDG